MKKNKIIISLLIICISFICGCFSYKDIEENIFVTAVIVDTDKDNKVVIYCEGFKASRKGQEGAQGEGERIVFKGSGKTDLETIRDISLSSSYKLNYTQNKAIIFTERAAEYGLDNFIDFYERDQELLGRTYIAIYIGDVEKLVNTNFKSEKYIGLYIRELIDNVGANSRAVQLPLNEFYNQRLIGDKTNVITIINLKKDSVGDKLTVSGGAIVQNDMMIGIIEREEGQAFNYLTNNVKSGTLEITNPEHEDKFVTLEILNSKTKTDIEYKDGTVYFIKNIHVKTVFAGSQKSIILNRENLVQIQKKAERNIKKYCSDFFYRFRYEEKDVFDVDEIFNRKYPNIKIDNIIEKTEIIINAKVDIESSNDTKNFK